MERQRRHGILREKASPVHQEGHERMTKTTQRVLSTIWWLGKGTATMVGVAIMLALTAGLTNSGLPPRKEGRNDESSYRGNDKDRKDDGLVPGDGHATSGARGECRHRR